MIGWPTNWSYVSFSSVSHPPLGQANFIIFFKGRKNNLKAIYSLGKGGNNWNAPFCLTCFFFFKFTLTLHLPLCDSKQYLPFLLRFSCLFQMDVLITCVFLMASSVLLPDVLMITYRLTDMHRVMTEGRSLTTVGVGDSSTSWITALFCPGGQGQTTQALEVT